MYYTRGNITEACPIKNAHHSYERERFNAKRKFVEFMRHYQKDQQINKNSLTNNDQFSPKKMEFSDYVRMMDTRTSDRPLSDKLKPIDNQKRRNYSSQIPHRQSKENKIIESCQPYFLTTISRPSTQFESTQSRVANYSKMRRNDPLPLQRARKVHII